MSVQTGHLPCLLLEVVFAGMRVDEDEGACCGCAQILSVDEVGSGIKAIRPKSLMDMMKVRYMPITQAAPSR